MGNRFSSIAAGNKDTADRRPVPGPIGSTRPGPIRSTRSSKHRASPYPHQSPKRAALERSGSSPSHAGTSHASSSSSSARVTRFRDDSPDTDSSNSDIEEGRDSHTTTQRSVYQGSDNAAHNERNQNATPPSCASTLSGPTRNSGAPSHPGAHCYTTFHNMPILSSPKVMSLPLDLRPIPACPTHSTSIRTSVHVQVHAQTTALPLPCTRISRDSSPDYESLNPNTQGQAVAELEESVEEARIGTVAVALEQARFEPSADSIARPGSQETPNSDAMREAGRASGAGSRVRDTNERWTIPSDTTGPPKIPKPPGVAGRPGRGGYVLREALKLDDARYCAIRTKMNELVEAHLEPAPYGKQGKERLEAYTREAVKILPVLDEYENQWPAHDFAAAHLNYWREKLKRIERQRAMALVESGELELESEEEDGGS